MSAAEMLPLAIQPTAAVAFDVFGTPAPKGSARAFIAGWRAVISPGGSKVGQVRTKAWDGAVREAARTTLGERTEPVFIQRPLRVTIRFHMSRPQGHWGKRGLKPGAPTHPATKPDIDKLARTTLDALTGLVFDDDSRIADLFVSKRWALPGQEGAVIRVEAI